jgi:hypothetical protein
MLFMITKISQYTYILDMNEILYPRICTMVQYCLHEGDEETVYTLYKYKLLDDWKNKYLEVIV